MTKTTHPAQAETPSMPRRRFRLLLATLGASESGATALGYALTLAAALMFASSVTGSSKPPQGASVMPGDRGGLPSE